MRVRAVALLVVCLATTLATPALKRYPYGIDVFLGDKVYKLKASLGDNVTQIVDQFVTGPTSPQIGPEGQQLVLNMLHNAAGGRCDACVTMVEALSQHFRAVSLEARPLGQDAEGKKRVQVSQDAEAAIATKICGSEEQSEFAEHVTKGCWEWLAPPYRSAVLRGYEGQPLEPRHVIQHKQEICVNRLKVCPPRRIKKVPGRCRACAEVFQTLDYYLRRDRPSLVKTGHRSKAHVAHRLTDLCDQLYLHFPQGRVLDTVQELCEEVVSEYEYVIARGFTSWRDVKTMCTSVTGLCENGEFDSLANRLQLFPLNMTTEAGMEDDMQETPRPEGAGNWGVHLEL